MLWNRLADKEGEKGRKAGRERERVREQGMKKAREGIREGCVKRTGRTREQVTVATLAPRGRGERCK